MHAGGVRSRIYLFERALPGHLLDSSVRVVGFGLFCGYVTLHLLAAGESLFVLVTPSPSYEVTFVYQFVRAGGCARIGNFVMVYQGKGGLGGMPSQG